MSKLKQEGLRLIEKFNDQQILKKKSRKFSWPIKKTKQNNSRQEWPDKYNK